MRRSSEKTFIENRTRVLISIYAPMLILAFSGGMFIPILPSYILTFKRSYSLVGIIMAASGIGTLVADIPVGFLVRRIGRKRSMILGIITVGISNLGVGIANSVLALLICRFVAGIGTAIWGVSRHDYIADVVPIEQRGRVIAIQGGLARFARFGGPLVGGFIGAHFGLRVPFLSFGCFAAASLILVVSTVIADDKLAFGRHGNAEFTPHMMTVFREYRRILLVAGSGQLLIQMVRSARNIVIPLYAESHLQMGVDTIGVIMSASSAVSTMMFLPAGILMDRYGRKFAYVPSVLIQTVAIALIPLTGGFASLLAAGCLFGFGNGLGSGTMMTLAADFAPPNARSEFLGMWRFIGDIGSTGAPIIVGGLTGMIGFTLALGAIVGFGLLGTVVLGVFVPETLDRDRRRC